MLRWMFPILLTFHLSAHTAFSAVSLKGVHPELLSKYQSATSQFTCLDGSKTISATQVNDDYCDCSDGSDEPGTSACPNSWFYCRNKGHEPKLLASQFVRDGVCDCCDGTDEPKGVCENTCHLAIAAEKSKLQQAIEVYKQALATKQQYISKAKARREDFASRSDTIDDEIQQQSAIVKQLEEQKEAFELEHRRQEDDARAEHEARMAAEREKAEAEAAETAATAEQDQSQTEHEAVDTEGTPAEAQETLEEEAASAEAEEQEAAAESEQDDTSEQDAATLEHDKDDSTLSAEELGRKIASQWTNDPEAAGHVGDSADHAAEEDEPAQDLGVDSWEQDGQEHQYDDAELNPSHHDSYSSYFPGLPESEELREVRRKYQEEKAKLEQLEKFKAEAAEVQGVDLGAYDEYLELAGKCFTSYETQFTYEACFFREASQREGHGSKTNIGKWKGFEAGHTAAVFDDGDWCWQAPNRSFRLQLECAQTEKIYGVEEPSRCVYKGRFQTPAACHEDGLHNLEAKLARLHEIETEIKNEVVHDEL